MPNAAIVSFNSKGFRFSFNMLVCGDKFSITNPIVSTVGVCSTAFYFSPELGSGIGGSAPNDKSEVPLVKSINSNPYPAIVFFDPT